VREALSAAALLVVAAVVPASAEEPSSALADRLNLGGSVRAGYWTSDRDLDDRRNFTPASLWLKATPSLAEGVAARVEGWVGDDRALTGGAPRGELREALLSWHDGDTEAGVGRRIVTWGRADKINPTDVVGSRDYTRLFVEDDDQRRGSTMATLARTLDDYTATAYWLPEFRPNVVPIEQLSGVEVRVQGDRFDPAQAALRLDHTGRGFDWAISYLNGIDRDPDARIEAAGPAGVTVETRHRRTQAFGADFAANFDKIGVRGELAYRLPESRSAEDAFDKGDVVTAVLGADRNFGSDVNANVQYLWRHVVDYVDPRGLANPVQRLVAEKAALINNQLTRTQHGASFRVGYTALNDTLALELAAIGWFTDGSYAIRPKASYAITDEVKAIVGLDLFFGDGDSFFGNLRQNRVAYVELRYGF
jgi:hypothetical protein